MFDKNIFKIVKYSLIAIAALVIVFGSWFTVGAGDVKVLFNSVTGSTKSYSSGFYFKLPLVTSTTKFDVKTQKQEIKTESASKDLQKVDMKVVVNYHLDYAKVDTLYKTVGEDYELKVISPAVLESAKAASAQFDVEKIIEQRDTVKTTIEKTLAVRLASYHIILESVNLVDIGFDEQFNKVVEEKQMEQQKIKTAEYIRQQAEENKKTTILNAQAEAEKQRLLSISVTKDVIALKWIEAWKEGGAKMPETYVAGNGGGNILLTPNLKSANSQ